MSLDPSISFTAYWQRLCLQFEIPTLVAYALSITEYFTFRSYKEYKRREDLFFEGKGRSSATQLSRKKRKRREDLCTI